MSDHQPFFIIKKKKKNAKTEERFVGRSYKNYDATVLQERLAGRDWSGLYNTTNVNTQWEQMYTIITEEADKMCPIKEYKISNMKPPYLTNDLDEQMKERDYFYTKAKRTGDTADWNIAKFNRNKVKINIRKAKTDFIKAKLHDNWDNAAKFWRTLKTVFPIGKSKKNTKIKLNDHQGEVPQVNIPNYINNFFVNVGTLEGRNKNRIDRSHDKTRGQTENIFDLEPITEHSIYSLIKRMNTTKASGMQNLKTYLIKDALLALTAQLTYLVNTSIETQSFPQGMKQATVIPIPKQGDLTEVTNYRPISLLPQPSKILEKVFHRQTELFLEEGEFLSNHQFGFRKNRSTMHAITELTDHINKKLNVKEKTVALFIDFKKNV